MSTMKLPDPQNEAEFDAAFEGDMWNGAATSICRQAGCQNAVIERAGGSEHIVFFVGDSLVLKIYRPFGDCFRREQRALELIGGKISLKTPDIVGAGNFEGFDYLLMTRVGGEPMTRAEWLKVDQQTQIGFVRKLALAFRETHEFSPVGFENTWPEFVADRAATFIERQIAAGVNRKLIDALPRYLEECRSLVPVTGDTVFMHSDVHFGNLNVRRRGDDLEPYGLFDFADSRRGHFEYDFLAVCVLMIQGQREVQREFFRAYGYAENELGEEMRRRLMMLTMLYETADLRRYALRLGPDAIDFTLDELERGIWSFACSS